MNVFDEMGVYWAEMADQNQTEKQVQFLKNHLELSCFGCCLWNGEAYNSSKPAGVSHGGVGCFIEPS